ncbi:MAG: hypothetical protein LBT11_00930 [Treponema sp.]|jgi:hypothetical protein|nr:hypothetical protein [Treponema sp.]
MKRLLLAFMLGILPLAFALGQTGTPPFSVYALYLTHAAGGPLWQPDWPVDLPPDAFLPGIGAGSGVGELSLDYRGGTLIIRRDATGVLRDFPFYYDGAFYQVVPVFAEDGEAPAGFLIEGPVPEAVSAGTGSTGAASDAASTEPVPGAWKIQVLEYRDQFPSLVRVSGEGGLFFVVLEEGGSRASETWYGEDGRALAILLYRFDAPRGLLREVSFQAVNFRVTQDADPATAQSADNGNRYRHYDSFGNVSALIVPGGQDCSASYAALGRPWYWRRNAGVYRFQWDERGLLAGLSGLSEEGLTMDLRYEYILDGRGNWIERQESSWEHGEGYLLPHTGPVIHREIIYQD